MHQQLLDPDGDEVKYRTKARLVTNRRRRHR